jgi:subtilisin family serine protease
LLKNKYFWIVGIIALCVFILKPTIPQKNALISEIVSTEIPVENSGLELFTRINKEKPFRVNVEAKGGQKEFTEGDRIYFNLKSGESGYAVLYLESQGHLVQLLPNYWNQNGEIKKDSAIQIPPKDSGMLLPISSPAGMMKVRALVSKKPLELADMSDFRYSLEIFPHIGLLSYLKKEEYNLSEKSLSSLKSDQWNSDHLDIKTKLLPQLKSQSSEKILKAWETLGIDVTRGVRGSMPQIAPRRSPPLPKSEGVIVYYDKGHSTRGVGDSGARITDSVFSDARVVSSGDGTRGAEDEKDAQTLANEISKRPGVKIAVPNYRVYSFAKKGSLNEVQWAMNHLYEPNLNQDLKSIQKQIQKIVPAQIAVVDQGLSVNDKRLSELAWVNKKEIANNGKDDDENGLIDDVNGYNFYLNNTELYQEDEEYNHGSFVSSIIAGRLNENKNSFLGISPKSKIIVAVGLGPQGFGDDLSIFKAIEYAADSGAKVINLSLGGIANKKRYEQYIAAHKRLWDKLEKKGVILVCAAGNDNINLDETLCLPACLPMPNVLNVMAMDPDGYPGRYQAPDKRWLQYTNYGKKRVHLAAPGSLILGIQTKGKQKLDYGTSFAAPVVTAAISLIWGQNPSWDYKTVIRAVLETVKPVEQLKDKCRTGGVINIKAALAWKP